MTVAHPNTAVPNLFYDEGDEPRIRRFTSDEYHRLYDAGILVEESLELLNGVIYYKGCNRIRPFSLDDYHRMLEAGILKQGDPVELIDGVLRMKMTKGTAHDSTVAKLARRLGLLAPDCVVRAQSAISSVNHEPEPDVVLAEGPEDRYDKQHPRPHEILLLIEVADSSLPFDSVGKRDSYANAGIVQYWAVSLPERCADVYADPTGASAAPAYRGHQRYQVDAAVPVTIGGKRVGQIVLREVLPTVG